MSSGRQAAMAEKPSLAQALRERAPEPTEPHHAAEESSTPVYTPPSRRGTKVISGHFDPAVSRQLRMLALDEDSSVQELLREAVNDLFIKRGKAPIA
jgi:hypothetical protein